MKFIILLIVFFIFIFYFISNKKKTFTNNNNNSEIHFITLWSNNKDSENNIYNEIKKINNARIIKKIIINKKEIAELYKNVSSGGKNHIKSDYVTTYIIEVPNEYTQKPTSDNPKGELVNKYMYDLKVAARNYDYKNYLLAHGSFNIKEANEFFEKYYKYLGNFKNIDEIFNELNSNNFFYLYDRLDINKDDYFKNNNKDINLITDSIPAMSFSLRQLKYSNKQYVKIDSLNKKLQIYLRNIEENYYPVNWLLDIKNNNSYIIKNNVKIPKSKNHFMIGLYHMFIHKNGKYNENKMNILNKYSKELNIDIDLFNLINFLYDNNYKIKKPVDNGVQFYYNNFTKDSYKKNTFKIGNYYFYKFNNKEDYDNELYIYSLLKDYNIMPKNYNTSDNNLLIQIENCGKVLRNLTKNEINNVKDYKEQISNIINKFKKHNLFHNDIHGENITINNKNKIYLIDFEHAKHINKPVSNMSVSTFPDNFNSTNTFYEYITTNVIIKCFNRFIKKS